MSTKATWIWSFGDFELYHHRKLSLSREERGHIVPTFWQLYGPNCLVRFRKTVQLEKEEMITVSTDGEGYLQLGRRRLSYTEPVVIPPGEHVLQFVVGNPAGIPALFVEGTTIFSDSSWEATAFDGTWGPVGFWNLDDRSVTPTAFELPCERLDYVSKTETEGGTLYDFGKETTVKLVLTGLQPGAVYRVCYGESVEEALDYERAVLRETFTPGRQERVLKTRACRYVHLTGGPADVCGLYEYLPLETKGAFRSSDPLVDQIYHVSDYTLRLCSRLFYLDGIKRDTWVWAGDAYQSFLLNYYCHFDPQIIQRTLLALRGGDPLVSHLNTIVDYSLYWLIALEDYHLYTGDSAFIRRLYGRAVKLMEFCILRQNQDGLLEGLPGDWVFIDWADMDKRGALCAMQMLYCRALEAMASCSALAGNDENRLRYAELAGQVREKIEKIFWDESLGAYVTNLADGKPTRQVRRHANIFAVLFGFADEKKRLSILNNVLLNDEVPQITTPYFKFYELDALCRLGRLDKVTEIIRAYWGGMLAEGATTFWEEYDPRVSGAKHLEMYGEPYDKSLCHAWGASPLYLLGRYYAGVSPVRPGFAEFEVCPALGGLDHFEAEVPILGGFVRVRMDGAAVEIETNVPGGYYTGDGKRVGLVPGRVNRFSR